VASHLAVLDTAQLHDLTELLQWIGSHVGAVHAISSGTDSLARAFDEDVEKLRQASQHATGPTRQLLTSTESLRQTMAKLERMWPLLSAVAWKTRSPTGDTSLPGDIAAGSSEGDSDRNSVEDQ
jgi:ABC-type transporter Mla subunit MlaD